MENLKKQAVLVAAWLTTSGEVKRILGIYLSDEEKEDFINSDFAGLEENFFIRLEVFENDEVIPEGCRIVEREVLLELLKAAQDVRVLTAPDIPKIEILPSFHEKKRKKHLFVPRKTGKVHAHVRGIQAIRKSRFC